MKILILLFLVIYPLAFISPVGSHFFQIYSQFSFSLPIFFLLSFYSLQHLIKACPSYSKKTQYCLLFSTIFLIPFFLSKPAPLDLNFIGYITIPLWSAYLHKRSHKHQFYLLCFTLWFFNTVACLIYNQKIGLVGNQNWLSGTILCLTPWSIRFLQLQVKRHFPQTKKKLLFYLCTLTIMIPSLPVLWHAGSRASALAFAITAPLILISYLSKKRQILFITLSISIVALGIFFAKEKIHNITQRDIRLPLWQSSIQMISDAPFFGHGPDAFQDKFALYRNEEHSRRLYAAARTMHPHNEFLNLAIHLGLPIAIFLTGIFFILYFRAHKDKNHLMPRFSLGILFVQGMLDKNLIMPPSNILFCLFLGGLLKNQIRTNKTTLKARPSQHILAIAILSFGLFYTFRHSMGDFYHRKGVIESHTENSLVQKKKTLNFFLQSYSWDLTQKAHTTNFMRFLFLHPELMKKNQSIIEDFLNEHPYYGINPYSSGQLSMLKSEWLQNPQYKNLALKNFRAAREMNPYWLHYHYAVIQSEIILGKYSDALKSQQRLKSVYQTKIDDYFKYYSKINKKTFFKSFLQHLQANRPQQALHSIVSLTSQIKFHQQVDPLTPNSQMIPKVNTTLHDSLNQADLQYWIASLNLKYIFRGNTSIEQLCQKIFRHVQLKSSDEFSWPFESWQAQKASPLSYACLISQLCEIKGYQTIIHIKKANIQIYCIQEGQKTLCISPQSQTVTSLSKLEFNELKQKHFYLFAYPQSFSNKSDFFAILYSSFEQKKPFSLSPSMRIVKIKQYAGTELKIHPLKAPFEKLEQDLTR